MTRQSPGNVLDKIQAELAETKRREDELRRARRAMFRSQPDLSKVTEDTALTDPDQTEDNQSDSDIEVSFVLSPVCSLQSPDVRTERFILPGGRHPVPDAHQGEVSPDFSLGEQDPV